MRILARDAEPIEVKAVPGITAVEPTGVGDAFRAGFLAGLEWGFGHERAAQVGCSLAAYVVETVGTQEYAFTHDQFVDRVRTGYGEQAAADVARATSAEPSRSRDPAYDVARNAVLGRLLADVLLAGHPAPGRYVDARGRVVGDHADQLADLDRRRRVGPAR